MQIAFAVVFGTFYAQEVTQMVTVMFINNNGTGFADKITVDEGTTVRQLVERQMRGEKLAGFVIRHNREEADADAVLEDGDRVSVTSGKIEGAC